jgi:hypothetical protein
MKIGDLPEDMQSLLGQIAIDSRSKEWKSEASFAKIDLPLYILPLSAFPRIDPEHDPGDDRKFEDYLNTAMEDFPPVVIAHGYFIDGRHRVWAAREKGEGEIWAVDASKVLGKRFVEEWLFLGPLQSSRFRS